MHTIDRARVLSLLTTNLDGRLKLEKDRLADKDLASLRAEVLDLVLLELDSLARAVSADWIASQHLSVRRRPLGQFFGRPRQ